MQYNMRIWMGIWGSSQPGRIALTRNEYCNMYAKRVRDDVKGYRGGGEGGWGEWRGWRHTDKRFTTHAMESIGIRVSGLWKAIRTLAWHGTGPQPSQRVHSDGYIICVMYMHMSGGGWQSQEPCLFLALQATQAICYHHRRRRRRCCSPYSFVAVCRCLFRKYTFH